jgi:hypothetical protein
MQMEKGCEEIGTAKWITPSGDRFGGLSMTRAIKVIDTQCLDS